jgi:hypothetical protein
MLNWKLTWARLLQHWIHSSSKRWNAFATIDKNGTLYNKCQYGAVGVRNAQPVGCGTIFDGSAGTDSNMGWKLSGQLATQKPSAFRIKFDWVLSASTSGN